MLFVLYNINLNKGRKEVVVLNSKLIVDYHKRCVERIMNVNSYEDLDRVTQFLFNNGLHQIDLLITNKNDIRFSKILTKRFDVKRVIVPSNNIRKQVEKYLKHWGIDNTHIFLKE
jgi:3-isopropylmalate dehydratase small subunit